MGDLPDAVDNARGNEIPKILSDGGDQGWHTPCQDIEDQGGTPASQLVGDYAAQQRQNNLKAPTDANDESDLFIR